MSRRLAREKAMQILFQIDVGGVQTEMAVKSVLDEAAGLTAQYEQFVKKLVFGVLENLQTIDGYIKRFAIDWEVERIANVDRTLLRMAIYEMIFLSAEIPSNVSINEAVELAKTFSNLEGSKFINGILDQIKKNLLDSKGKGELDV